jgi:hypothetical protein
MSAKVLDNKPVSKLLEEHLEELAGHSLDSTFETCNIMVKSAGKR